MTGIQASTGLITGVSIQDTVNQLIAVAAQPRNRLTQQNAALSSQQVSLSSLTALVVGVQLTTNNLGQASLFSSSSVSSSNANVANAKVTGTPAPGTISFAPVRLASTQQLTSSQLSSKDQLLGQGDITIHRGGFLDDSVALDELNGGKGIAQGSIRITDRSGANQVVDLRYARNINDVVDAINSADGIRVVASVKGDRLQLADASNSYASSMSVSEVSGGTTAADLGLANISTTAPTATGSSLISLSNQTGLKTLLDKRGLTLPQSGTALQLNLHDGSTVNFTTSLDAQSANLGNLINAINTAGNGRVQAQIASDGKSLELRDLTNGSNPFSVSSPSGSLAEQLGFAQSTSSSTISGSPLLSGLSDTLLSSLNAGAGFGGLGQISIANRAGSTQTIDLSSAQTLGDVISTINAAGNSVRAQLNRTRTGIEIVDSTGSTTNQLSITDADATRSATKLQIAGTSTTDSIDSGSLHRQYISENTLLSDWNQGKGLTLGSIRLTDSAGNQTALSLTQAAPKTVGDVINAINRLSIGVDARLNETGDGILLIDTAGGNGSLTVSDVGLSTVGKQLGIAGTSASLFVNGAAAKGIDGAQTVRINSSTTTTASTLIEQLNASGIVSANLLTSGGSSGVRLLVSSTTSGAAGRVAIASNLDLSFSQTAVAQDALLAFGADSNGNSGVLVNSPTNTFDRLVSGLEITLTQASSSPVTLTVAKNNSGLAKQIQTVVDQFNKVRDKIKSDASYDTTSNKAGVLFGNSAVLRVENALSRLFGQSISGAGSIKSIAQLGVRINDQGKLEFDQSKLEAALAKDPEAVKEFFTKENTGFSAKARSTIETLAGVKGGALISQNNVLQSKIDLNNSRIDGFNIRLDKQRTRLLTQFYNMETAIAKIQSNLSSISSIQPINTLTSSS